MKINRTDLPGRARELAAAIQKRYPKADEYPYRSWSYPQGYLLMGFIHLWEKTGDELYYQYVLAYCLDHVEAVSYTHLIMRRNMVLTGRGFSVWGIPPGPTIWGFMPLSAQTRNMRQSIPFSRLRDLCRRLLH